MIFNWRMEFNGWELAIKVGSSITHKTPGLIVDMLAKKKKEFGKHPSTAPMCI